MNAHSEDLRQARADARADLVRRLFAVAVSIGFAATLAQMAWVQDGTLPGPAELNQTLILATALLAAILGWEGHLLSMTERPLVSFWRFLISLALVFIYMFLLLASAHPECVLWTLAVIFVLYVAWDVLTIREQIASYDPALARATRIGAAQVWHVYAGGFEQGANSPRACGHVGVDRLFCCPGDRGKRTRLRPHPHDLRVRADRATGLLDGRGFAAGRGRAPPWHAPARRRHPGRAGGGHHLFPGRIRPMTRHRAPERASGALSPRR
jgi:hypothetical protein